MPAELVLIHGWGFDAHFWDAMAPLLPQFTQTRLDLGFFSEPNMELAAKSRPRILVGHSLGFVHGVKNYRDWDGWIAINGFPRFVATEDRPGCTSLGELRSLRARLHNKPDEALSGFYRLVGGRQPKTVPQISRLLDGLDELRESDIEGILLTFKMPGLALAGDKDPLVPIQTSEALGRLAKKGGLLRHEKAGHLLPQSEPFWCARAIGDFAAAYFD